MCIQFNFLTLNKQAYYLSKLYEVLRLIIGRCSLSVYTYFWKLLDLQMKTKCPLLYEPTNKQELPIY